MVAVAGVIGDLLFAAFGGLDFGLTFGAVGGFGQRRPAAPKRALSGYPALGAHRRPGWAGDRLPLSPGLERRQRPSWPARCHSWPRAGRWTGARDWLALVLADAPRGRAAAVYALIGGLAFRRHACLSSRRPAPRPVARGAACPCRPWASGMMLPGWPSARRAGRGYLFVHRLLQEHFAAAGGGRPTAGGAPTDLGVRRAPSDPSCLPPPDELGSGWGPGFPRNEPRDAVRESGAQGSRARPSGRDRGRCGRSCRGSSSPAPAEAAVDRALGDDDPSQESPVRVKDHDRALPGGVVVHLHPGEVEVPSLVALDPVRLPVGAPLPHVREDAASCAGSPSGCTSNTRACSSSESAT